MPSSRFLCKDQVSGRTSQDATSIVFALHSEDRRQGQERVSDFHKLSGDALRAILRGRLCRWPRVRVFACLQEYARFLPRVRVLACLQNMSSFIACLRCQSHGLHSHSAWQQMLIQLLMSYEDDMGMGCYVLISHVTIDVCVK